MHLRLPCCHHCMDCLRLVVCNRLLKISKTSTNILLRFCMKTTATEMAYDRDVKLISAKWEYPAVSLPQLKLVVKFRNYAIWSIPTSDILRQ